MPTRKERGRIRRFEIWPVHDYGGSTGIVQGLPDFTPGFPIHYVLYGNFDNVGLVAVASSRSPAALVTYCLRMYPGWNFVVNPLPDEAVEHLTDDERRINKAYWSSK
jgi:hypothetical protein